MCRSPTTAPAAISAQRLAGNPLGVLVWLVIGAAAFALRLAGGRRAHRAERAGVRRRRRGRGGCRSGRRTRRSRGFEFIFPTRPAPKGSVQGADRDGDVGAHARAPRSPPRRTTTTPRTSRYRRRCSLSWTKTTTSAPAVTVDESGNRRSRDGWQLPAMDLLADKAPAETGTADNAQRAMLIEETLASFGVDAQGRAGERGPDRHAVRHRAGLGDQDAHRGRSATRDNKPVLDKDGQPKTRIEEVSRTRVRVQQITSLANDLALALAAPSIRIEAPVPGKPVLGIEVPNTVEVARDAAQRRREPDVPAAGQRSRS